MKLIKLTLVVLLVMLLNAMTGCDPFSCGGDTPYSPPEEEFEG